MRFKGNSVLLFVIAQLLSLAAVAWFISRPGITQESQFALSIVVAVVFLMSTLFILAGGFSLMNLTDRKQALGLPEGSIRAMIALILILVFIMFGTYLYNRESTWADRLGPIDMPQDAWVGMDNVISASEIPDRPGRYEVFLRIGPSAESSRLAQQLLTTVGTLVVAVAGFYFGSAATATAVGWSRGRWPGNPPVVESFEPHIGQPGTTAVRFTIRGQNFGASPAVRLERNGEALVGTVVEQTPTTITTDIVLASSSLGPWDLVVENADGTQARRVQEFQLQAPQQ